MLEQGLILADVIRKWYPTICYELCLLDRMPRVRISYEASGYGRFESDPYRITMYAVHDALRVRGTYLFTLAHEVRHAWQCVYRQAPTEADCDEFAGMFLKRYHTGPVLPAYAYSIDGEPLRCPRGHLSLSRDCSVCAAQQQYAEQLEAKRLLRESERRKLERAAARRQAKEAKETGRAEAARTHVTQKIRRLIDHHPHNGRSGWWCIDGNIWVEAASAGEAVIAASELLGGNIPEEISYMGPKPPRQVQPIVQKQTGQRK